MNAQLEQAMAAAVDTWTAAYGGHDELAERRALTTFLEWFEVAPRSVISHLAWVLAKTKNRARRKAVDALLDEIVRPPSRRRKLLAIGASTQSDLLPSA